MAAGVLGRVAYGSDFNFGGAGRDADHHLEVRGEEAAVLAADLLDEAANHHLRSVEVSNHAVSQRPYGPYARVYLFVHQLCFLAEGDALACIVVKGYDAWLVEHNLTVLVNDGVGGAQVNCKLLVEK